MLVFRHSELIVDVLKLDRAAVKLLCDLTGTVLKHLDKRDGILRRNGHRRLPLCPADHFKHLLLLLGRQSRGELRCAFFLFEQFFEKQSALPPFLPLSASRGSYNNCLSRRVFPSVF